MDITKIDNNFTIKSSISRNGLVYINVEDRDEFSIHGVSLENGMYRRMPEAIAKGVSEAVYYLHSQTAGGRIRFRSNSPYIAVHVKYNTVERMPHIPLTGSAGLDLYRNDIYVGTFIPSIASDSTFDGIIDLPSEEAEYVIHLPLYSGVSSIHIGLMEGSSLTKPSPYSIELPVVYYGSSITQGGCASRPGNAYQNVLSRLLNVDHVNLGFSGSAKGEDEIVDFIKSMKMSAFVCDYDHNAPTAEHLLNTHSKLFKAVRAAHPTLPILLLTRPKYHLTQDEKERLDVVKKTYDDAIADGDKNVYFIPGPELINEQVREAALVDNCHPNDSGFVSMAYAILPVLDKMLNSPPTA